MWQGIKQGKFHIFLNLFFAFPHHPPKPPPNLILPLIPAYFSILSTPSLLPPLSSSTTFPIQQIKFCDIPQIMPKRAESDVRRRIQASGQPHAIQQLCLDGIQITTITPSIKRLLEGCVALEYLTMNDCELKSLQNFPHLRRLIGLEISDNSLTDDDLAKLSHSPQVNFLAMSNNRITSTSSLRHLKSLPQLQILQLHDNQCCQEDNYRDTIFNMLPSVKIVDCLDRAGHQPQEENPSEYISNIGNSRLDLLELLDQQHEDNKEEFVRTATTYAESGLSRVRKNSLDQAMAANPSHFNVFHPSHRSSTPQKGFLFMRSDPATNSDSEEDDIIKSFKKKYHKKE